MPGYNEMLKALKKPNSTEYKEIFDWLGEKFDPEFFDINAANAILKDLDKYLED